MVVVQEPQDQRQESAVIKEYDHLVDRPEARKRLEKEQPALVAARDQAVAELKRERIINELANHNQRRPRISL